MTEPEGLDVEAVVEMNADLCAETGEHSAVLDPAGLEAAVSRPWSGFGGQETFPTMYEKAAALLHGIAARQVFENGNKRTAWVAAVTLLELNGIDIGTVETVQSDMFVRAAALDHSLDIADLAEWFEVAANRRRSSTAVPAPNSFRYAAEALTLSYAVGVRTAHTDAGVVLEFFINDPTDEADYVILQRVLTAPETLIQLASNLEQRYTPPTS